MRQYTYLAKAGSDYVRDDRGRPIRKSIAGWDQWAVDQARQKSPAGCQPWQPEVNWVDHLDCFDIRFTRGSRAPMAAAA